MKTKSYRVTRWIPEEKRFDHVGNPFWVLARAREQAAAKRLRNPGAQFAIFDQDGNMVEDEAGKLVS